MKIKISALATAGKKEGMEKKEQWDDESGVSLNEILNERKKD